jgi:hypothetical protein
MADLVSRHQECNYIAAGITRGGKTPPLGTFRVDIERAVMVFVKGAVAAEASSDWLKRASGIDELDEVNGFEFFFEYTLMLHGWFSGSLFSLINTRWECAGVPIWLIDLASVCRPSGREFQLTGLR